MPPRNVSIKTLFASNRWAPRATSPNLRHNAVSPLSMCKHDTSLAMTPLLSSLGPVHISELQDSCSVALNLTVSPLVSLITFLPLNILER